MVVKIIAKRKQENRTLVKLWMSLEVLRRERPLKSAWVMLV